MDAGHVAACAELAERHRAQLRVHCYRMLGSFDEAEDLVQETFLRAWRARGLRGPRDGPLVLYRIATNACLDFFAAHEWRPRPYAVPPTIGAGDPPTEIPWLQPFADRLLDEAPEDAVPS